MNKYSEKKHPTLYSLNKNTQVKCVEVTDVLLYLHSYVRSVGEKRNVSRLQVCCCIYRVMYAQWARFVQQVHDTCQHALA